MGGPSFGTRESRHVDSAHQVALDDVLAGARFDDSIVLGARGTDWHDRSTDRSVFHLPGGNGGYEIPLGALTSVDTQNLLAAGRVADGDQMAGASLRVMCTAFATGRGAGATAARLAGGGGPGQQRDPVGAPHGGRARRRRLPPGRGRAGARMRPTRPGTESRGCAEIADRNRISCA